ncbi:alpha/beta hydrolase [Flavobacterium sp. SUN052]|uniref:alpha/beta fold hydrolase n=1 Tax=Flavobacterium sp. SUN052 TaxID=3002441 RepID=UPI00237E216D|nr:alpha/beta hydrolase [Flavobacterium sp. SUN052]MEC4003880.1 alpha/beta hydrolase [Flavobacterium sp. SUN052]
MQKIIQKVLAKSIGAYINILSYVAPQNAYALAYQFFSEPRKGKLNPYKLPKTLFNAQQKSYSLNEHQFQTYTWNGNDDIILLIHGWESNSSRWKKLIVRLKKTGKTIIAIDGPAHGLSNGKEFNVPIYAQFINQIVQEFNPKTIIGHSIGGNAIAYFQHHYNHNFEKMILIGAPSDFKVILNNYIKMLSLNNRVHNSLKEYIKKRFNLTIEDFSASKFLSNATIPGIIAHDIQDNVVLYEEGKKIAKSWTNAQFISTNGLGHSMHDEYLYQSIVSFIEA